jgi:hypothetical protein
MSFQESFCRRQFFVLVGLCPAVPSLLSCPLLAPFVTFACGDCAMSFLGEVPLVAGMVSLEYWFRPSRPRAFCGGRPPLRGAGAGLRSAIGVSGIAASVANGGIAGSSTAGVGVGSGSSISSKRQPGLCFFRQNSLPSPFLRSARPFRRLAASFRWLSRSFSRCSFSR